MGKKSSPPPAPNYAQLATQQAELDRQAADEQTQANRPNQVTPWGTSTWQQDDQGNWTQSIGLTPSDQAALDQDRAFNSQRQGIASGLLGRAGESLGQPLSLDGLPGLRDYDFSQLGDFGNIDTSQLPNLPDSGFGAVEGVRDAMMGRLAPGRAQSRESEIQRLKSQGLPENSEAFQRAMKRLDEGDTDASQQALLAATDAYGDIFNRGLDARGQLFREQGTRAQFQNAQRDQQFSEQGRAAQLAGLLRQQGLTEQERLRQSPMDDFLRLTTGTSPGMPQMPSFMGGTSYQPAEMMGAANNQYQAAMDRFNAGQAQSQSNTQGLVGLASAAAMFF